MYVCVLCVLCLPHWSLCGRQSRDKPALETFLEQATKFNLTSHDLYKQAVALKKRMEVRACMHC